MMKTRRSFTKSEQIIRTAVKNQPRKTEMQQELAEAACAVLDRADVSEPGISDRIMDRIIGTGMWIAAMRGAVTRDRYSHEMVIMPSTEVGTRVAGQLRKLASGIAIFRGKKNITASEMKVVAKVARHTCPDFFEAIVGQLYVRGGSGYVPWTDIMKWTRLDEGIVTSRLADMEIVGLVQRPEKSRVEHPGYGKWRLTRTLLRLMRGLDLYADEKKWRRK